MAVEVGAARQRIIRRPRLTAMLDESSARIRLLVAPAGYGKTTLARQWLGESERRDVWYRGGPASADVAALAAGIAEAASEIVPDAGRRMRDRLRATGHAEEDVAILAELFTEDVTEWPPDAWLAIDDYHFAMESVASERFVEFLTEETPIQMLITSRRRPSWATARRILYGEIFEIDRRALAMEDREARAVLGRNDASIEQLIARARGWPAVLGLAAIARDFRLPEEDLPEALHNYFAEEMFQATEPAIRRDLAALALAPRISLHLTTELFGSDQARRVIETGVGLGVLTQEDKATLTIHPLLRMYLNTQIGDFGDYARQIGEYFVDRGEWDYAFEVASSAALFGLLERIIVKGLDPMLRAGRVATVERWIDRALRSHLDLPVIDLAEAELAFRRGEHDRAYILAAQASLKLSGDLRARAHVRAGHSALLSNREAAGLEHFQSAARAAEAWEPRREALIGLYFAASELDAPQASTALAELEASNEDTIEGALRLEVLRLTRATRTGVDLIPTIEAAYPKLHLVDRANEPLAVTALIHTLAWTLNLTARYSDALSLADKQLAFASRYRLELPVVHARLNQAISRLGLAEFQRAVIALEEVGRYVPPSGDTYLEATVRAIMCRLLCAKREFDDAVALTEDEGRAISSPPLRAEYLSSRALAFACRGDARKARNLLRKASQSFNASIELAVLAPSIETIIAMQASDTSNVETLATTAWEAAERTGNFDSFVCSFRAEPRLLEAVVQRAVYRRVVGELLARTGDLETAKRLGVTTRLPRPAQVDRLTPRETQVLAELEQGLPNREIARRLFLSEATVKVHVRHIYEKLGVRTRAELLAKRVTQR